MAVKIAYKNIFLMALIFQIVQDQANLSLQKEKTFSITSKNVSQIVAIIVSKNIFLVALISQTA